MMRVKQVNRVKKTFAGEKKIRRRGNKTYSFSYFKCIKLSRKKNQT